MKLNDIIINEAYTPNSISRVLIAKGYKKLGSGADQVAYLEPVTGMILKIFGTEGSMWGGSSSSSGTAQRRKEESYTEAQQSFVDFANYCQLHPDNPFLPNFTGWERFEFQNDYYLQIRMEKLFELPNQNFWGDILEEISDRAESDPSVANRERIKKNLYSGSEKDKGSTLAIHLGEDGFNQLWATCVDLAKIADRKGYILDLHGGNFMLGSDSHIVISDPFYTGS